MHLLTANVSEGEIFNISDIKLSGNLIITEEDMHKLVTAKPGEVFSRAKLEKSAQQMTAVLANIGYAFAQVTPMAPNSSCFLAIQGDLWPFECGRQFLLPAWIAPIRAP